MCYFLFRCVYLQPLLLLEAVFPWQQRPTGRLVVVSRSLNLRLDLCGPSGLVLLLFMVASQLTRTPLTQTHQKR